MKYDPDRHHRRSVRLKGYDYAQPGAYFVTICTQNRECLFGENVAGKMRLNALWEIVRGEWFRSAEIRAEIELHPDEFVVMPNHIHGIVWIISHDDEYSVGAHGGAPQNGPNVGAHCHAPLRRPPRSLGSFIAGFKSAVTKRINQRRGTPGAPVWQRNYYEHIIRDERALNAIRRYIAENPMRWHLDRYNDAASGIDPLARDIWQIINEDIRTKGTQKP